MPQITCGWFGEIEIWLAPYARPIIYIHDGVCVWYIHLSLWWLTKLDMDMVSHETHMHKTQHKLNNWTKLQRCGQCFERQLIKNSTVKRFELLRSKSNGLAIHRLNHSATLSSLRADLNHGSSHYKWDALPLRHTGWCSPKIYYNIQTCIL